MVLLAALVAVASPAAASAHVVFLNFSDGSEAIEQARADDARTNNSELCWARPFLPWSPGEACGSLDTCRRRVLEEVRRLWQPFDVAFTTERPATGDYAMVVVGPPSGTCRFGVNGVAPIDCGDRLVGNVAFVFECVGARISDCARSISHELGHTFGLDHSNVPCDLMSADALDCAEAAFVDAPTPVPALCDGRAQNSYRALLERLGPNPDGPSAPVLAGGCSAAGRPAPAPLFALMLAMARRRPKRTSASSGNPEAAPRTKRTA